MGDRCLNEAALFLRKMISRFGDGVMSSEETGVGRELRKVAKLNDYQKYRAEWIARVWALNFHRAETFSISIIFASVELVKFSRDRRVHGPSGNIALKV